MKTLLFIDTNILLDFYRVRNEVSMQFVEHIEKIAPSLICTYQVEMEFKKNRQSAILDGLSNLKSPSTIPRLGILSDDRSYAALTKDIKSADKRLKKLHARLGRILEDPIRNDPIYKILQRIFKKTDDLTLHRGTPTAHHVRRLALKRFLLGYPPRKKNDTSTGDAVNWEWIIDCASREKASVLLVSRDSDYGVEKDGKSHINDWLREEFKDRVSQKANITMTPLLSTALKTFQVPVSRAVEKKEQSLIKDSQCRRDTNSLCFISRLRALEAKQAEDLVDSVIADSAFDLIDSDAVCSAMAETNAVDWIIDEYKIDNVDSSDDPVKVKLHFSAAGEQLDDKTWCGTSISGEALALIDTEGHVEYSEVQAQVDRVDPDV